jgi:hypothetical protein
MDVGLNYIVSHTSNVGSKRWMELSKGMSFRALMKVLGLKHDATWGETHACLFS